MELHLLPDVDACGMLVSQYQCLYENPMPQRSPEIKFEWLDGGWPWVSGKLSLVFSPPGWLLL